MGTIFESLKLVLLAFFERLNELYKQSLSPEVLEPQPYETTFPIVSNMVPHIFGAAFNFFEQNSHYGL